MSLFVLLFCLSVYFLPSIIALGRGMTNRVSVFLLNLFLGWTLLGWVVALVWASARTAAVDHPVAALPVTTDTEKQT
jgi:hypothetical protein